MWCNSPKRNDKLWINNYFIILNIILLNATTLIITVVLHDQNILKMMLSQIKLF